MDVVSCVLVCTVAAVMAVLAWMDGNLRGYEDGLRDAIGLVDSILMKRLDGPDDQGEPDDCDLDLDGWSK